MTNGVRNFGLAIILALSAGCGGEPDAATTTPEVTPEQKDSMKNAMEGGGGPAMMEKMKKSGKTKPD